MLNSTTKSADLRCNTNVYPLHALLKCGASPAPQLQSVVVGGVTWHHRGASRYYLGAISELYSNASNKYNQYICISAQRYLDYFKNTCSKMKPNIRVMNVHTEWNCLMPILSSLVKYYLFRLEYVSYNWWLHMCGKIATIPWLFQGHLLQKKNIKLWTYTPNGTVWYPLCLVWSSTCCFRDKIVSFK